MIENIFNIL